MLLSIATYISIHLNSSCLASDKQNTWCLSFDQASIHSRLVDVVLLSCAICCCCRRKYVMSMTHMDGPFTPPCNRSVHHPPARRSKRHWNTWATSLSYQAGNAKVTARVLILTFSAHHRSSTTPVRSETRRKPPCGACLSFPPTKFSQTQLWFLI